MVSEGEAGKNIKMDHRQSLLNLKTKIVTLDQITVKYRESIIKVEASKKEVQSLKDKLKALESLRIQSKNEVESLKAELDRRDKKIKDTNKQLVNFKNQNETLEQQVKSFEDTLSKQKDKMTNLQRSKAALNTKNKELESAVAERRKDEEIEKFSLENEISNLKEQLAQLNSSKSSETQLKTEEPSTTEVSVQTDALEVPKQSPVPAKPPSPVILPKKVKTCDRSVMTERSSSLVDDAYPLHCSKCTITLEKPIESIINTMTSMPPLLPQMPGTPRRIPRVPLAPPAPPPPTPNPEVSTTIEKLQERLNHLEKREKKRKRRVNSINNWNPSHPMHCCSHNTAAPQNFPPANMMTSFFEKMMNFADERQPKRPGKHVKIRKKRLKQRKIKTKVRQRDWEVESVMTTSNDRDSAIDLPISPMAQNPLMDDSNFSDGLNSQMEVDEPFRDTSPVDESFRDASPVNKSSRDASPVNESSRATSLMDKPSRDASPVDESSRATSLMDKPSRDASPVDESSRATSLMDKPSRDASPVDKCSRATSPMDKPSRGASPRNESSRDASPRPMSPRNCTKHPEVSDTPRASAEPVKPPTNPTPAVTASAGPKKRGRKPKKPVETSTQDTLPEVVTPKTPARRGRKPLRPLSRESSSEIDTPSQRKRTSSKILDTSSRETSPEAATSRLPVRPAEKPSDSVEPTQISVPKPTRSLTPPPRTGRKCIITKDEVLMKKLRLLVKDKTTVGPPRFEESLSDQEASEVLPGQKRRISHLLTNAEIAGNAADDDLTLKRRRVTRSMTKTDEERKATHREIAKTIVIPPPAVEKPRKLTILRKNPPQRILCAINGVQAGPSSSQDGSEVSAILTGVPSSSNNAFPIAVTAELPKNIENRVITCNTSSNIVPPTLLSCLLDKKVTASPRVDGNSIVSVAEIEKKNTLNGKLTNYSIAGTIQFRKSDIIPGSCTTIPKSFVMKKQPENVKSLKTIAAKTPAATIGLVSSQQLAEIASRNVVTLDETDSDTSCTEKEQMPVKQQANVLLKSLKTYSKASKVVEKMSLPTLEDFTPRLKEVNTPEALKEVKSISEESSKEKTEFQMKNEPADPMEVTPYVPFTEKSSDTPVSPEKIKNPRVTANLDETVVSPEPKNEEKLDQNQPTELSSEDENLLLETNKSLPDKVTSQKVEKSCCVDVNPEKMEIEEEKVILNDDQQITEDMSVLDMESPASPDVMEVPEEPRKVAPTTSIYDQAVIAEDSAVPAAESTAPTLPAASPVVNSLPACAALPIKQLNTCPPVVRQLRNRKVALNAPAPPAKSNNKVMWPQDNSIASMLHRHLTITDANRSKNQVKYRQAAAAKKYQDSKSAIKRELHSLLGAQEWSNVLHESVVQTLAKYPSMRGIVQGILAVLTDCSDSEEPINREFTPPAPMMTETEQKIVTLLYSLENHHPNIISFTFSLINFQLFRTITNSSTEVVTSFARVFIALARMKKDRERVRMFICDAIYHLSNRSCIVLHVALSNWPEVLNMYDSTQPQHLQICIASIIRSYKTFDDNRSQIMQMRNLLRVYYKYPDNLPQSTEQIQKMLAMIVEGKHDMTVTTAILLLAKKEGTDWTYKNVVTGELMQIIVKNKNPSGTYNALRLLGFLLRAFPVRDENGLVGKIVEPLREILDSGSADVEVQEGVVSALLSLSRHKFQDITKAILTWKPTRPLPSRIHDQLQFFFSSRSFSQWNTIQQKISS